MGTQQILLIILGFIVVGVATVVGITIFSVNAKQANADALIADCHRIAALAQAYYSKPVEMGGGNGTFDGYTLQHAGFADESNVNGSYSINRVRHDHFHVRGIGVQNVRVSIPVYPDSVGSPIIWVNGILYHPS